MYKKNQLKSHFQRLKYLYHLQYTSLIFKICYNELTSPYARNTLEQDIKQETSNIKNHIFILYCECNTMMQQSTSECLTIFYMNDSLLMSNN